MCVYDDDWDLSDIAQEVNCGIDEITDECFALARKINAVDINSEEKYALITKMISLVDSRSPNKTIKALVDPASQRDIIRREVLVKHRLDRFIKKRKFPRRLQGLGGMVTITEEIHLHLQIGGFRFRHYFDVTDRMVRPVLLGIPVLTRLGLIDVIRKFMAELDNGTRFFTVPKHISVSAETKTFNDFSCQCKIVGSNLINEIRITAEKESQTDTSHKSINSSSSHVKNFNKMSHSVEISPVSSLELYNDSKSMSHLSHRSSTVSVSEINCISDSSSKLSNENSLNNVVPIASQTEETVFPSNVSLNEILEL